MPRKTKGVAAETTAIVLRVAADHATDFEAMFDAEEIPICDDFTRRGRFLEARLVRAIGGGAERGGVPGYLPPVAAGGHEAPQGPDPDPPVRGLPPKAEPGQHGPPLGRVGDTVL